MKIILIFILFLISFFNTYETKSYDMNSSSLTRDSPEIQIFLEPSEVYIVDFKFDSLTIQGSTSCLLPNYKKTKCCLLYGAIENVIVNSDSMIFSDLTLIGLKYILIPKIYFSKFQKGQTYRISGYANASKNYLIFNKLYESNFTMFVIPKIKVNNIKCYKFNVLQKLGIQKKIYDGSHLMHDYFDDYIKKN